MESIPSILSFLICDCVIIDELTKKKTIVGVFDRISTPKVPAGVKMGLFARLTDMEGTYKLTVRVIKLGDKERLMGSMETHGHTMTDRLAIMDLALNLPPLRLPEFGRYEIQLLANDVYLGRATVEVAQVKGGE